MKNQTNQLLLFLFIISCLNPCFSQEKSVSGTKELDKYLSEEHYNRADSCLYASISHLEEQNNLDSLLDYIYYVGSVELNISNEKKAERRVLDFADELMNSAKNDRTKKQIKIEVGSFYELLNDSETAYNYNAQALDIALSLPDKKGSELGLIENNMGVYATRMGNIGVATDHVRRGNKYNLSDPETDPDDLYLSTSTMGNMMWYNSKYDSAFFYYQNALAILKKLEPTPYNKYYRSALLKNNSAGLHNINGRAKESIKTMESAISDLQHFLASEISDKKKKNAEEFFYQMIDNLAGAYKDQGNFVKAKDLLSYSFNQKIKRFDAGSPEVYKGYILMGQIDLALKNFTEAEKYLTEGIKLIDQSPHPNHFWYADAHFYLALVFDRNEKIENALKHYIIAEEYFEKANEGVFDELYLAFVTYAAPFYAKHGNGDKAISLSNKASDYIYSVSGKDNLLTFAQKLTLGEVDFYLKNYNGAIKKATEALHYLEKEMYESANKMDSIQLDFMKPFAIYIIEKSKYEQNSMHNIDSLKNSYQKLNEVIDIIGRQKSISTDENMTSVLIADFDIVFEFTKFLAYELYAKTKNEQYLDKIINLNESTIYNRIRTRLSINESAKYADVPNDILATERELKSNLNEVLQESSYESINSFIDANKLWDEFMDQLQKDYPKYYKLKYASIEESLYDVAENISEQTTIVRYLFIEEELYVIVIDKNNKKIIPLDYTNVNSNIEELQKGTLDFGASSKILYELYNSLWLPLEEDVKNENVVIIPDAELFNLSFESLTQIQATNPKDQIENCLLKKHVISYNYSLYLLEKNRNKLFFKDDFIAFAPEFTDKMKNDYQIAINDSVQIDRTYLTLLPQPYNLNLAKKFSTLFKGTSFLNENSTAQVFKNSASEHKIIHIGTHAESNNVSPELSRLIFAKNVNDSIGIEDNSLYTYEIYNTNLASNLAILTACETGKPTFQAGEGMISLAHAFNYAGSESILTSLWKIDEQSSAEIIELFYENLTKGLAKDKALQLAKIKYLKTAEGRTANPEYWAGLILIGDTSPIEIGSSSSFWWWIFGVIGVLIVFLIVRKLRK